MPIGCVLCIMKVGLKGSEIDSLPKTDEEFIQHLKEVHHIEVTDDSTETEEGRTK